MKSDSNNRSFFHLDCGDPARSRILSLGSEKTTLQVDDVMPRQDPKNKKKRNKTY